MWGFTIVNCVACQQIVSRASKLCHVSQFGGDSYQVTRKPIEPQGDLSKRNISQDSTDNLRIRNYAVVSLFISEIPQGEYR